MMTASSSRSSTLLQLPGLDSREGSFKAFKNVDGDSAREDWKICVHPQGWVYFYNPVLKVATDHDIREPRMLDLAQDNCSRISLTDLSEGMEINIHLTVGVQDPSDTVQSSTALNLVVNHNFCIASHFMDEVRDEAACLLDPKRLNRCRRLYWNYLWNHPVHVQIPPRAIEDASDALTWFYTDNLISGARSIVPFSKAECEELSRVVRDLSLPSHERSVSKTVFLAWFLREVCSFRDAEYWGQYTQRASVALRQQRLNAPPTSYQPPPIILALLNFVINFLFFGILHSYRAHVKMTSEYRGRLANVQQNWERYIERLVREYSHFLLISTVLLSATVGFLAVPDIPEGAQLAATVSALASLGSIIVGVFAIWRHQANTTTADSFTYMHNAQHNYLGLYGHALLLSLPPTLLVWAILTFTLSIIVSVMHGITGGTWAVVSAWVIFGIFVVLFLAVVLALYTFSIIYRFQHRRARICYRIRSLWNTSSSDKTNDRV